MPSRSLRSLALALLPAMFSLSACAARTSPTPQPTFTPTPDVTPLPETPTYILDTGVSVFRYRAVGNGIFGALQVPGTFRLKEGEVQLAPEADGYRLKVRLVIDGNSATAVDRFVLNAVKSALEVEKYPFATFAAASKEILQLSAAPIPFTVSGTLDLHGRVRQLEFPFTLTLIGDTIQGSGDLVLDLYDYDVNVPTMFIKSQLWFTVEIAARLIGRP